MVCVCVCLLLSWFGRLELTHDPSLHPPPSGQRGKTVGRKFVVHIQQPRQYELVLLVCKEGEIELIVKRWETYSIVFVTISFFVYTKLNDLSI